MMGVSLANAAADFEIAAALCHAFGHWDAIEAQVYGIEPELVLGMFHNDTATSLAEKYNRPDAMLFLARWQGAPAGCIAFGPFDGVAWELHKFYVDPGYRGRGIGGALMRAALAEMEKGHRRTVLLQTTVYMTNAIAVYESFAFSRCPPFRAIPDSMTRTEVFMSRKL